MQVTKQLLDEFESEYPLSVDEVNLITFSRKADQYMTRRSLDSEQYNRAIPLVRERQFGLEVWLKQRDKLWRVYDVASWGIRHVARANYPHREYEAIERLQQALQASQPQESGDE